MTARRTSAQRQEPTASPRFVSVAKLLGAVVPSLLVGALIGPTISDYFAIGQSDIRYTYDQLPDGQNFTVLDHLIDAKGNSVLLASVRLKVINVAFRQGFIDRAELVPIDLRTRPQVAIQGVDKRPMGWRETQIIEVRALITTEVGPDGPAHEQKAIDTEVRLFDNVGRQVGRYSDGLLAKIILKATGDFTRTPITQRVPGQ